MTRLLLTVLFVGLFTAGQAGRAQTPGTQTPDRMNWIGIGVWVQMFNHHATITTVFPDSPAMAAGIKKSDIITQIDDTKTAGLKLPAILDHLHGVVGSTVKVIITRDGEAAPLTFSIKREAIHITQIPTAKKKTVD